MTIKQIAEIAQVSVKTIQRDIEKFNPDLQRSPSTEIDNPELIKFIMEERDIPEGTILYHGLEKSDTVVLDIPSMSNGEQSPVMKITVPEPPPKYKNRFFKEDGTIKKKRKPRSKTKAPETTTEQEQLSSNGLMWFILINLLVSDAVAFYIITRQVFSDVMPYSELVFGWLGIVSGLASIVSYSRIKDHSTAEAYKYIFAALQVAVFLSAAFESWVVGKILVTVMIGFGFTGVITSIRHK